MKNSCEFGFITSHGGLPIMASNPLRCGVKTSGNSISQWKNFTSSPTCSTMASSAADGL